MGIKLLYNDNLRKLPNEYGGVSVMLCTNVLNNQTMLVLHDFNLMPGMRVCVSKVLPVPKLMLVFKANFKLAKTLFSGQ